GGTVANARDRIAALGSRLRPEAMAGRVHDARQRLDAAGSALGREVERFRAGVRERLGAVLARLEAVSPIATIARGFAVVSRRDGELVDRVDAVRPGDPIGIRVSDGTLDGFVWTIRRTET